MEAKTKNHVTRFFSKHVTHHGELAPAAFNWVEHKLDTGYRLQARYSVAVCAYKLQLTRTREVAVPGGVSRYLGGT